jgi:hypothetical protein
MNWFAPSEKSAGHRALEKRLCDSEQLRANSKLKPQKNSVPVHSSAEDQLVEQTDIGLLAEIGWAVGLPATSFHQPLRLLDAGCIG